MASSPQPAEDGQKTAEKVINTADAEHASLKAKRPQPTLLDLVSVLALSAAVIIFIFSMAAKFLGSENFERLPVSSRIPPLLY